MIRNENNEILKQCVKCKKELTLDNFNVCNKNIDGLQSYCRACQSDYKYDDGWCQDNKEHIVDYYKAYRENRKGYYLYIVLDNDKHLYVGATEILKERINQHLSCNSNIKELIKSNNWTCIKYLDISNIVNNREEMLLLENSLIELYNTDYNHKKSIIRNVDKHREFELLSEIHSFDKFWITYCENEHKKNAFIS